MLLISWVFFFFRLYVTNSQCMIFEPSAHCNNLTPFEIRDFWIPTRTSYLKISRGKIQVSIFQTDFPNDLCPWPDSKDKQQAHPPQGLSHLFCFPSSSLMRHTAFPEKSGVMCYGAFFKPAVSSLGCAHWNRWRLYLSKDRPHYRPFRSESWEQMSGVGIFLKVRYGTKVEATAPRNTSLCR